KETHPILTSFALWANKDDANTVFAGEIIGNNIKVQVPPEINLAAPLFITYAGADYMELRTSDGSLISNNSQQYIPESGIFIALRNGKPHIYNISVTTKPYFAKQTDLCLEDSQGNVWYKFMDQNNWVNWSTAVSHAKKLNIGYLNKGTCGLTSGWDLPRAYQMQLMINYLPLADRRNPDEYLGVSPEAVWFNKQGFFVSGLNLWGVSDVDDDTKAYVWSLDGDAYKYTPLGISAIDKNSTDKVVSTWFVNSGDGIKDNLITDFIFTPEGGTPLKGIIAGKQIFVTVPSTWANPGMVIKANVVASTQGKVSYNGVPITDGSILAYNVLQPIPITVTAINGDKNIYTLYLKPTLPTPPKKPDVPGLITVCTSSSTVDPTKKFNRIIAATVGNNFYQNYLPLPGTCSQLTLGNTSIKDLAAHKVMWYSFFNENPIGSTTYVDQSGYYHDIIPKFKWVPSNGL